MSHSNAPHAHPICPTCQSDLTGRETLERFSSAAQYPLASDDLAGAYDETAHLILFLGALAQAAPYAAAAHTRELQDTPDWVGTLSWLARDLAEEAERRLGCLREAGHNWEQRAERTTADKKEG